ncbi:MAG TPA: helix-turn-helix domain-containing protein [Armatimonadota bacterium]|jgi:transposase
MYRIHLTESQRQELRQQCRDPRTKPRTRDRLEMVRLSDAGWSPPRIGAHLGVDARRVRHYLKAYQEGGFAALPDKLRTDYPVRWTPEQVEALRQEVQKAERTWTARPLAEWVAQQQGVRLSLAHFRERLKQAQLSYKRTSDSLRHKQDPEAEAAKAAELDSLKGGSAAAEGLLSSR